MSSPSPVRAQVAGRDLWAERQSRPVRWVTTIVAAAVVLDTIVSLVSGSGDGDNSGTLNIGAALFAVAALSVWWRMNALAVALVVPLAGTIMIGDPRAGIILLAPLVGILAATASRTFMLIGLTLSVVWIALIPVFSISDDDPKSVPSIVMFELAAVGIGLAFRWRAVRHERDHNELEAASARLAEQAELERRAAESVRRSVARDLHDVVAHGLTVIKLQADVAVYTNDLERSHEALGRISDASHQALTDLRVMLRLLQAPLNAVTAGTAGGVSDAPRDASTLRLAATGPQFRATLEELGIPTTLVMDPRLDRLTRGEEITLHRVLQEVTTNVLKHAPSGSPCAITLDVWEESDQHASQEGVTWRGPTAVLRATNAIDPATRMLADDTAGRTRPTGDRAFLAAGGGSRSGGSPGGAAAEGTPRSLRLGLLTMRERVESVGGVFRAGPVGDVWVTEAAIPVRLVPGRGHEANGGSTPEGVTSVESNETTQP